MSIVSLYCRKNSVNVLRPQHGLDHSSANDAYVVHFSIKSPTIGMHATGSYCLSRLKTVIVLFKKPLECYMNISRFKNNAITSGGKVINLYLIYCLRCRTMCIKCSMFPVV